MVQVDTSTREARVRTGELAELKLIGYLLWHGITVRKIGQEDWLPDWVHLKIRFNYDPDIELLKHMPDLDTGRALIQVKDAPNEQEYQTVTLEKASYRASKRWFGLGVPVLIVWLYQDRKSFYGQWVNLIHPEESNTPRQNANGSMTPFYVVRKNELEPVKEFMEDL